MELLNRCWAEIDLDNLKYNFAQIKNQLRSKTMIMAVVKADAYGHGAKNVALALEQCRADWFAVAELNEARVLRAAGITRPILVLGPTYPEQIVQANTLDVTHSVFCLEDAIALAEASNEHGVRPKVHLQLDTGMGRYGFNAANPKKTVDDIAEVCALKDIEVTGIYTHFATADGASKEAIEYVKQQHWLFYNIINVLKSRKITFRIIHCANSATAIRFPQLQYSMVRAGIALYGLSPTGQPIDGVNLKPVMTLRGRIARVHDIMPGQSIGYGCTFTAQRPTRVAVVSIGYADGISRSLSNRGFACTSDGIAPIIGNICMDALMLDVTDMNPPSVGDSVTFFGGDVPISADNMATLLDTISYELLCRVARRVPRVYISGGEIVDAIDYTM